MTAEFEAAYLASRQLAAHFHEQRSYYLSPGYQESEVRKDFVDKLFTALGWDVNHERQTNPYEQEVKVERSVATGPSQRRADYAFFIAPNFLDVSFYAEAKKPFGDIATAENYFQVIRYGWNSETPLAVLTNFERFEVVDCRYKPDIRTALDRNILRFTYQDFLDREQFARIYYLFAREAVADGSLSKYARTLPRRRGAAVQRGLFPGRYKAIDESFLEELAEYRKELAIIFKRSDSTLDGDALTELTQRTLDRLVFIRFLEDKGIEAEYHVARYGVSGDAWRDFITDCRRLDSVYNGIVFKYHDVLDSDSFKPDSDEFAGICEKLCHSNSPYDFNAIPIYVLGQIYERFLGSVITATPHRVRVEEKPEVRHAGGVYYTPEFIVRRIVSNTVGRAIKGKSPEQISKLRFADITCGSGSFLLGIFELLLRYHARYYNQNVALARRLQAGRSAPVFEREGSFHLTLAKKREILLQNIFGVDIDAQAVEVAQLSLYLRLLEDETIATTRQGQVEIRQALLPSLSRNVVCGNSLVEARDLVMLAADRNQERRINAMDVAERFPNVMREGGFTAIVGNPPYIRVQVLQQTQPETAQYLKSRYRSALTGNFDIYVVFIERALQLVRDGGLVGFITPHKFTNAKYGTGIRGLVTEKRVVTGIVHFGHQQVFEDATTYTCLLFLQKSPTENVEVELVNDLSRWVESGSAETFNLKASALNEGPWALRPELAAGLLKRVQSNSMPLEKVTLRIFQGLKTGADRVFIVRASEAGRNTSTIVSLLDNSCYEVESALLHPLIKGGDSKPFGVIRPELQIIFPYRSEGDGSCSLMSASELRDDYPKAWSYLRDHKKDLDAREGGRFKGKHWYQFSRNQALDVIQKPKIFTPDLAAEPSFSFDSTGELFFTGGVAGGYGIVARPGVDPKYLLAVLNSDFTAWFLKDSGTVMRGGYQSFEARFIRQIPIVLPNTRTAAGRNEQTATVQLVEAAISTFSELQSAKTDREKGYLQAKLASIRNQIDDRILNSYGLTESEISSVRAVAKPTPDN